MGELIALTLIGLFLFTLGFYMCWKGALSLLHRYHYAFLHANDKKKFGRILGISEMVLGLGCAVIPWINLLSNSHLGYWIGLIAILTAFAAILLTILRFNQKRLF